MRPLLLTLAAVFGLTAQPALAADRLDLSLGTISRPTHHSPLINSFRIGASWDTDYFQASSDNYYRSLRIETGVGLNRTSYGDVRDLMIAPVVHYQFTQTQDPVFVEVSVGATYISQTRWEIYHDLSSRLLFADRIGVGYSYEKTEISLNFYHISNAGIKPPNPGADMLLLRTSIKL